MKGHLSLKDFIKSVKDDLKSALDTKDPFFYMDEVELEVLFFLDAEARAGARFFVVDIGGKTKASQYHKVRMKLTPFVGKEKTVNAGPQRSSKRVPSKKQSSAMTHPAKQQRPTVNGDRKAIAKKNTSFTMPKSTRV